MTTIIDYDSEYYQPPQPPPPLTEEQIKEGEAALRYLESLPYRPFCDDW